MASRNVEGAYARLKGLADSTMGQEYSIEKSFADDFVTILKTLRDNVDDPFSLFDLPSDCFILRPSSPVVRNVLRSRISQLLHYLENVHLASNRVLEIGSVYNLIKDQELKSRCSDLLSAPNHFDRVINQATQVLEERLRTKLPDLQNS